VFDICHFITAFNFILTNYQEYVGDDSFLVKATDRTNKLMEKVQDLFKQERAKGGVLDIDTETISSLRNYVSVCQKYIRGGNILTSLFSTRL
jgi:pyruvate-formate lyase